MKQRGQILSNRLANNLLTQPVDTAEQVLETVLGVQAQYVNHGLFNLMLRLNTSDSLQNKLLLGWGQRQTVHYYTLENWLSMTNLLRNEARWPVDYLTKQGINLRDSLQVLAEHIKTKGPSSRKEISRLYGSEWSHLTNWSALFLEGSRQGKVFMTRHSTESTDLLFHWNDQPRPLSNEFSLLNDYFKAYGPASKKDAAHFFGVKQAFFTLDFDKYWNNIAGLYYSELEELELPEVQLLGKFDPLLVAYKDKDVLFQAKQIKQIWRSAGQISAILLIHGEFSGTWRYQLSGRKMAFYVTTTQQLLKRQKETIEHVFNNFSKLMAKEITAITYDRI